MTIRSSIRLKVFLAGLEDSLTLRQQLTFATAVLCFILIALVATAASYVARKQAREAVRGEMAELARTIADRLDRSMSARFQDAALLSELEPLRHVWTGD